MLLAIIERGDNTYKIIWFGLEELNEILFQLIIIFI